MTVALAPKYEVTQMIRTLASLCLLIQASAAAAAVTVIENPLILADQNGNATATIVIGKAAADTLALSVTQFVQTLQAEGRQPAHTFTFHTECTIAAAAPAAAGAPPTVAVKLTMTGLTQAGKATATLLNGRSTWSKPGSASMVACIRRRKNRTNYRRWYSHNRGTGIASRATRQTKRSVNSFTGRSSIAPSLSVQRASGPRPEASHDGAVGRMR